MKEFIAGFIFGCFFFAAGSAVDRQESRSYITKADFGTLAEAMQHGCEPEQQRIEETIRDFCNVKHPLTKGTENVGH